MMLNVLMKDEHNAEPSEYQTNHRVLEVCE